MAARETGKDRAARIPYDYPRRQDRVIRWRVGLTAVALAATLGAVAWGMVSGDTGRLSASHGPLAEVHATWDSKCEACHVEPTSLGAFVRGRDLGVASAAGDAKCRACHMASHEQEHHRTQRPDLVRHCADCHRDHRGREASLVRAAEGECTSCHRDLNAAVAGTPELKDIAGSIRHFHDGSHPEFRSAKADPGRIKFNHALHMAEGLKARADGVPVFTFARLAEADRARYGGGKADAPVKLECTSCHVADAGDAGLGPATALTASPPPPGGPGAYMLPIRYDMHCAACHTLNIPGRLNPAVDGDPGRRESAFAGKAGVLKIRHRLQPGELHQELLASFLRIVLPDPLIGNLQEPEVVDRLPAEPLKLYEVRVEIGRRTGAAELQLFGRGKGTCTECHYYDGPDGQPASVPSGGIDPSGFSIAASKVPAVWFEHARFDHSAHRAVSCRDCHPRAYPDDPDASGRAVAVTAASGAKRWALKDGKETWAAHEDVLIPGIQTCRACHAPASLHARTGGAGYACTECHRYHNGDRSLQGRGALARGVPEPDRSDIASFLRGEPRKAKP